MSTGDTVALAVAFLVGSGIGVTGGGGVGVAVNKSSGVRTYMKMGTVGVGFGTGRHVDGRRLFGPGLAVGIAGAFENDHLEPVGFRGRGAQHAGERIERRRQGDGGGRADEDGRSYSFGELEGLLRHAPCCVLTLPESTASTAPAGEDR